MEQLNVITKRVDVLPMVKYYMDQLGIYGIFSKYVKKPERCTVDPAQILSVMVRLPVPIGNHHLFFSVRWNGNTDFRARLSSALDTFIKSVTLEIVSPFSTI